MSISAGAFLRLVCAATFLTGCNDEHPATAPDTIPPLVQVVSPLDTVYDSDGDKLVDVHLRWSGQGVLPQMASLQLRSLEGVNGTAGTGNLLATWRVEILDSTELIVHETVDNLLHGGQNHLELTVADTAGNVTIDTVVFTLPHGALFTSLPSGAIPSGHGVGAVVCADDHRAYVTIGRSIAVVDADSLRLIATVPNPTAFDNLSVPLCVLGDPVLYVTEAVDRFDRSTMQWLPRITGSFGSEGIAQSRSDPNILYVGETVSGGIGLIDRQQATRTGATPIPWSGTPEDPDYVFDVAVLNGDSKIYFTRYLNDGGVLVADPRTGVILKRIGIGGPAWPDSGRSDAFVLSHDDRSLYVAVLDGNPRGVVEINTQTDAVVRTLALPNYVPQEIALSPSGQRLFVTTQDRFANVPSENVLIDLANWQVVASFPRPRTPGATRWDGGVAFHPNGKLIFVGRDQIVDVYLNRE